MESGSKIRKFLNGLERGALEQWPLLIPFWEFAKGEWEGVKKGWLLFLLIAVPLVLVGYRIGTRVNDSRDKQIESLKQDRDKYFLALQPWQALAASIYPNTPPDKRIDMLLLSVTQMRGVLNQVLEATKPKTLPERIELFLSKLGSNVVPALRAGVRKLHGDLTTSQIEELNLLSSEPGGTNYLQAIKIGNTYKALDIGICREVEFEVNGYPFTK